jgi:hypothetical protein
MDDRTKLIEAIRTQLTELHSTFSDNDVIEVFSTREFHSVRGLLMIVESIIGT